MLQPGAILAGRYRAGRTLGAGGMGVILEGTHVELGTPVAIKLLHEQLARDPDRVERFLREARAAAQLRGEHVCRVHDCGTLEDGAPFLVMERLTGCDLSALLDQLGPLAPDIVATYALQVCAGVAEAHAVGIVHRDLKPTNIFRTHRPDGSALLKILDFGLAKPMNGHDLSLTQTTNVMGSPRYMSPEQLKSSKVVDPRIDIWALGVVMYELLTEKPPFDGETITELALNIATEPAPSLPARVPAGLAAIVMRCLEKDPGKRYPSVAELASALEPFATASGRRTGASLALRPPAASSSDEVPADDPSAKGTPAEEPGASAGALGVSGALDSLAASAALDSLAASGSSDTPAAARTPAYRRRAVWLAAAACGMLAAAGVVYVAWPRSSSSSAAPAPAPVAPSPTPITPSTAPSADAVHVGTTPAATADAVDAGVAATEPGDAAVTEPVSTSADAKRKRKKRRSRRDVDEPEDLTRSRH